MDPFFEIPLVRDGAPRNRARSFAAQLKAAILDGKLRPGTQLPPTRKAPTFFGVSRNTAAAIYDELLSAGYVVMRQGSGTYVADTLPNIAPRPKSEIDHSSKFRFNEFWIRPDVTAAMGFWRDSPTTHKNPVIDFRPALVDSRLFPFDVFRRVSSQQLRALERKPAAFKSPQGNQGNHSLRNAIVEHIALTRAVVCDIDDVIVTSGAQQAFDLLARVLVTPNETAVAIEDPGYPPMRVAFAAAGARVIPVAVDDEGLIVEKIPADVRVICLSPSHQFPLGLTTSMRRRKALVAFARANNAVIVEDDYDGEFRYAGGAMEALRTAGAADVVFYVGTFSKCMLPSLRTGFIVAPDWAIKTLVAAKNCMDWHCPTPMQIGIAGFIAEGHLARHVRKLRQIYRERRHVLLKNLKQHLGKWIEPLPSFYGTHVAAVTRGTLDCDRIAASLAEKNIKIHSLSRYFLGEKSLSGFVFGYGAVTSDQIEDGIHAMRKTIASVSD
ncbi:MAG TPA: PLP-dependent aminotransferase family protein [Rudaea sp.]|jgi:GntR family transcriptional regulator/MocR family aminotransferase|nr:PLP-dependent aminotransferase family protein [Rudaea sp.]